MKIQAATILKSTVITRRAYGLRTFKATEIALYHALGALPEPPVAHRFFGASGICVGETRHLRVLQSSMVGIRYRVQASPWTLLFLATPRRRCPGARSDERSELALDSGEQCGSHVLLALTAQASSQGGQEVLSTHTKSRSPDSSDEPILLTNRIS